MADSRTELLEEDLKTQYRSCVMRAACLAQDKPATSEAVKTLEAHESADRWKLPDAEETVTILDQGPDDSKQVRQADHVRQGLCVRGYRPCRLRVEEAQHHRSGNSCVDEKV